MIHKKTLLRMNYVTVFFLFKARSQSLIQLLRVDRFGNVSVHTGGQRVFDVFGKSVGSHGNDRDRCCLWMLAAADSFGCFVTVHDRHLNVHQDRVEAARHGSSKEFYTLRTIFSNGNSCSCFFQNQFGYFLIDWMIFYQQKRLACKVKVVCAGGRDRFFWGNGGSSIKMQRQGDGKGSALAVLAGNGDRAAFIIDYIFDDGQPQT